MATQVINGVTVQVIVDATNFGGDTVGKAFETNDLVPLTEAGMARTPKDGGLGEGVSLDGTPILAATTAVPGTVKKATTIPNAAGATPTKAEYDALLAALKTAGIMA